MWGSSVRYGGMQFGTRTERTRDVIAAPRARDHRASRCCRPSRTRCSRRSAIPAPRLARRTSSIESRRLAVHGASPRGRARSLESIDAPMIASTRLVDEGCGDFSVGVGKVRRDYALMSNEYGPMFANTTVTCGAPLGFTVEGHGEYLADDVAALGRRPRAACRSARHRLGRVCVEPRRDIGSGWLARFGFEHQQLAVQRRAALAHPEPRVPRYGRRRARRSRSCSAISRLSG